MDGLDYFHSKRMKIMIQHFERKQNTFVTESKTKDIHTKQKFIS
jgi:hypothetical protein